MTFRHQPSSTAARTDRIGRPVEFAPLLDSSWRLSRRGSLLPARLAGQPASFHIWTQGCQMNDADSEELARRLESAGLLPAERLDDADLVVLNTCVVRQASEDKLFGKFRELRPWKMARAGRTIALTGCLAAKDGVDLKRRLPDLDLVFMIGEADQFVHLVADQFACARPEDDAFRVQPGVQALVPVIHGCNYNCTYCIVPFVRGREVSRGAAEIEEEVRRSVDGGAREVMLLGQTVNAYAAEDEPDGLSGLLRRLDRVEGLERIRFITSHPAKMNDELIATMAECVSVCEHLHLPVQSGDDQVLKRMARAYRADWYLTVLEKLRAAVPGIALSTDIIVGFPGEDEAAFSRTLELIAAVRFDAVYVAAYSQRPRTVAAEWGDEVPEAVRSERLQRVLELQRGIARQRGQGLIGSTVEVLVERHENGQAMGRTRHNRTVLVRAETLPPPGRLVKARVLEAGSGRLVATPAGVA